MRRHLLVDATAEATRFLVKAKALQALPPYEHDRDALPGGAEAAAVKRASLDLTKALSKLRRTP